MPDSSQRRIAIFFDAENFVICAQQAGLPVRMRRLVNRIREEGVISFARAYGDWTKFHMARQMNEFQENVIEMNQLPSRYGKNTADMQMVVDSLEMAILPAAPEIFVLVAGDRDFIPLVQKLKRYGKMVIGIGVKGATSGWLERICNTFLYYDNLVPDVDTMRQEGDQQASETAPDEAEKERGGGGGDIGTQRVRSSAFRLLVRAINSLERNGKTATPVATRQIMQQLDPTFDLSTIRLANFGDFAKAAEEEGIVEIVEPEGEDARLKALVAPDDRDDGEESEGEMQMSFGNPEDAQETYRSILQDKGIALIPWEQRVMLVNFLWERFAEPGSQSGFTIAEMSDILMECAKLNSLSIPQRAIHKITYSMNLGHVFVVDGECRFINDIWHTKIRPSCDPDEALDRINATYIEGIRRAQSDVPLDPGGLELLLFDRRDKRTAAKVRELLSSLKRRNGKVDSNRP
jgi:uncharacterized LabA/DUF88 family protein